MNIKNKIFKTKAVADSETNKYKFFEIDNTMAEYYGISEDEIIDIDYKISNDQTIYNLENDEYWGWYNNEDKTIRFIYSKYMLLDMCFPYGVVEAENKGQGKAYKLKIIKVYD